jgi:hypothetical protein
MLSRLARILDAVLLPVICLLLVALVVVAVVGVLGDRREGPSGEPVVSRSFYAERSGAKETGRVCSQTVVTVPGDVAVAVSCSYPPAESRIADLLEGAGQ